MSVQFTPEAVAAVVGDLCVCSRGRNGSVRVEIAALKSKGARVNFLQKARILGGALTALQAAGYELDEDNVRDGYKGNDGKWVSWPHMWVNQPQTVSKAQTDAIVASTLAALRMAGVEIPSDLAPATDENGDGTEPAEESPI
jgi:hypothetical protein